MLGWELDPAWAAELRRRFPDPRLAVVVGDALEIAWDRLPAPTRVAGNLPYNVATAIVQHLLPHHARIPRAAFLVQKEVADRLVAAPGTEAYGSLSVIVAAQARPRLLGRVKPGSFRPPPKVESAFVGLELQPPPLPAGGDAGLHRDGPPRLRQAAQDAPQLAGVGVGKGAGGSGARGCRDSRAGAGGAAGAGSVSGDLSEMGGRRSGHGSETGLTDYS